MQVSTMEYINKISAEETILSATPNLMHELLQYYIQFYPKVLVKALIKYQVFLNKNAIHDLEDLYDYIESHDTSKKADYVLNHLE